MDGAGVLMGEKLHAGHAKARALVAFPGQTPGSTMTGRLLCLGGRNRARTVPPIRVVPRPTPRQGRRDTANVGRLARARQALARVVGGIA